VSRRALEERVLAAIRGRILTPESVRWVVERGDLTGAEVLWHRAVEEVGGAVLREVLTEGPRLLVAGQA
jgi:hypothetical protein